MGQASGPLGGSSAEAAPKDVRRVTRRQVSAEEGVRIGLEGLRGPRTASRSGAAARGSPPRCAAPGPRSSWTWAERRLAGDTARAATSDEGRDLHREAGALKAVVADPTLENRLLKASMSGDGGDDARGTPPPRRPGSSGAWSAPACGSARRRRSSRSQGPRVSRRCEPCQAGAPEALEDRPSRPGRVWSRLPKDIRSRVVEPALDQPEPSPREPAVRFTDEQRRFVSEVRRARKRSGGPSPRRTCAAP